MAFNNNQIDPPPSTGDNVDKTSLSFLPRYFRTNTNQKFLNATVDQMISEGDVEKVTAFIGRKSFEPYRPADKYLEGATKQREDYQFEPAVIIKDVLDNVTFFKDYPDYINQLSFFNTGDTDHSKINSQEFYAWNPHIDWDKFVNYRDYYWLPLGPTSIPIAGQSDNIVSTYTVSIVDDGNNRAYLFSPDGLTRNPTLRLYRGQTYRFEVNCPNNGIAFKTVRETGDSFFYTDGVSTGNTYVESGIIEFTIPIDSPNVMYYVSKNDADTGGVLTIYDITESTAIDVEKEVIGKKEYTSSNDIILSNGMKVFFQGQVSPEKYADGNWYVEGVGSAITLIKETDLATPSTYSSNALVEFDNEKFDSQGFDVSNNLPSNQDYILINRSSKDLNPWSRFNRWFHKDIIESSSQVNNLPAVIDQSQRARRPIIEFEADLKLWNFGRQSKNNVTLVDTFTKDVFSTIEGSLGYNIDGIDLIEGMRVLFVADTDVTVYGRIFKVKFVTHLGVRRITLLPELDSNPVTDETVLVRDGLENKGKMFYFDGTRWNITQEKQSLNQVPLFDVFDSNGNSYGNDVVYPGTTFAGTKLFSYKTQETQPLQLGDKPFSLKVGDDATLGFPLSFRNIGNIGDILFEFNLQSDKFIYKDLASVGTIDISKGFLKKSTTLSSFNFVNGWDIAAEPSKQYVVRQFDGTSRRNFFPIDVYNNSGLLTDLEVDVFVNGKLISDLTDYTISVDNDIAYIELSNDITVDDSIVIKSISAAIKNNNGYYEVPTNFESNPINLGIEQCTLGEIINHVKTIADSRSDFRGTLPGTGNLRDLSNLSAYGKKIVQHSGPLTPVIYHFTDREHNVVKALRYAKTEYSKFKRNFIRVATDYGYDGITRIHFDLIMKELVKDKVNTMPFFFTDMVPCGGNVIFNQEVIDDSITEYPLIFDFDLTTLTEKAVLVYLNEEQLIHGKDYEFTNVNFVKILRPITEGDELQVIQYENTNGCYVPPTPSKLGLYPVYEPQIYIDDTAVTPTKVIQGHDGSIIRCFDDFRDDLLLELETRIYNNIKIKYNTELFDIKEFISGYYRTSDVTKQQLDDTIRQEFLKWSRYISQDYTKHTFYEDTNSFTYNYSNFSLPNNTIPPGFWRGIYNFLYDTDRPHSHPWEILGFTEIPKWWIEVYGPAPYTSDNLVLWNDISEGIIREPGKLIQRKPDVARPTILEHLPVNEFGQLLSPLQSNAIKDYVYYLAENEFTFGDAAPIENTWRRNSEYAFSLITAIAILRPAKTFSTIFDRARQVRDFTGQIVYKTKNGPVRFNNTTVEFPNSIADTTRVFTSGLINYVADFALSQSRDSFENYKTRLPLLQVNLSSKIGGFITKEKFKLVLDSRSPLNQKNVFVPFENYNIILNTSTPVLSIDYSGVIVEKLTSGFVIRGYNQVNPEFKYFKTVVINSDPVTNVGGILESFIDWNSDKFYNKSQIVRFDDNFFRVITSHTSSTTFELKYFVKLPSLPITGGRDVIIRSRFETVESTLHYGSELTSIQDVVDFLLGYGEWLSAQGFKFEFFNSELSTVINWLTSVKEFVFWTTQNWAAGSAITLSPSADELKFSIPFAVVDNIYDSFYEYGVYKQDGQGMDPSFINTVRKNNEFNLRPRNTADGIYHATLNLVQKEHVVILDNTTVFNDVIYDQVQGYRQERIKVVGYRTSDWQGDFNIPGFVYDKAEVSQWTPWKDYTLSDTVKYKEFYYSAKNNVPGTEQFDSAQWYRLPKKPESKLIPNWDYKANQFFDFYDLDTDSFDVAQQEVAKHLIGYQRRDYLENIINDDVAQYKFYQGMIRDKGTKNVLSKLFDPLSAANKDSLEFYEEWAIRLGTYGATSAFEEVEFLIDESKMLINPQPFELVDRLDVSANDFVYRILPNEVYLPTSDSNHAPFPTRKLEDYFVETAGYVRAEDVDFVVNSKNLISTLDFSLLKEGVRIWTGYDKTSWGIYKFVQTTAKILTVELNFDTPTIRITFNRNTDSDLIAGDYVAINSTPTVDGIYKIENVGFNFIDIEVKELTADDLLLATVGNSFIVYKFSTLRIKERDENGKLLLSSIDRLDEIQLVDKSPGELVWVDGENNDWSVWRYQNNYTSSNFLDQTRQFARSISVNDSETLLAIGTADTVRYFSRPVRTLPWAFLESINPGSTGLFNVNGSFGEQVELSRSGHRLVISVPAADGNRGYAALYVNDGGTFQFSKNLIPATRRTNEYFSKFAKFTSSYLVTASAGKPAVAAPALFLYDDNGVLLDSITNFSINVEVTDISSGDTTVAISFSDETVNIYSVETGEFDLIQTIKFGDVNTVFDIDTGSNFASSVAISRDAKYVAVGTPLYSKVGSQEGTVVMFEHNGLKYVPQYTLSTPENNDYGQFGTQLEFNAVGDQLAVYASGFEHFNRTTFDKNTTIFDIRGTTFKDKEFGLGAVLVFDRYDKQFVFGEMLEVDGAVGTVYGESIDFVKSVYIGDPGRTNGKFYEFSSPSKSWSPYHVPDLIVDTKKIKSVFMYDTDKSEVIEYLDFVDPVQGKILGLAEQELSYKTYYDPATYVIGTADVTVNQLLGWDNKQVGKLWWDLSSSKFLDTYHGSVVYKSNSWNTTFADTEVAVWEWVSSRVPPSLWDAVADTEEGLAQGISGKSKYGDLAYSISQTYDIIAEAPITIYYFWVKNKNTVPDIENRKYSANDVSQFISDPKSKGIRYVAIHSPNQFSLVNCKPLIADRRVAINFRYWTIDNTETNVHSHYQLIAEGDNSRQLNKYVEKKWIDSLIGVDELKNVVPDPKLPLKLRYGILNKPRQSMFVNRTEALKQFVERVNNVLIKNNIIDDVDISKLFDTDKPPSVYTLRYDDVRNTYNDLRFVNVTSSRTAIIQPVIENGQIIRATIVDSGRNYVDLSYDASLGKPRQGPNLTVLGVGTGAKLSTEINTLGEIVKVIVDNPGDGYQSDTSLIVRPFTVLVSTDERSTGKWAMYIWDARNRIWVKDRVQTYDVSKYWSFADWYQEGYNSFTKINFTIDFSYQLASLEIDIGEIVKVKNVGTSGWLLLEKIDLNTTLLDINSTFKVIGRQNGTIQLGRNLYDTLFNNEGYDGPFFDIDVFDDQPFEELRIILDVLKNNILVDQLAPEYNALFFASLRYVFAEQISVDWAFKTSFIRSKHNLGELDQRVTYQNDSLESYEDYVNEVKPYRTKVREFVSAYNKTEQSRTLTTDFDLPAVFDPETNAIRPISTQIINNVVTGDNNIILEEPYSSWFYNVGHSIKSIDVTASGSGYTTAPQVIIEGISTVPAKATAYISRGKLLKVIVDNPGEGYLTTPRVLLVGGLTPQDVPAQTSIQLERGPVRSVSVGVKFDRVSPTYEISTLNISQQFVGSGSRTRFDLKWPADIQPNTYSVSINGIDILDSDFTLTNVKDTTSTYARSYARVVFDTPPDNQTSIIISYKKSIELLSAADRIQYYYQPGRGQLGRDLGQLMQGVDYGGVELRGLDFEIGSGWDALPWFVGGWDTFDSEFKDRLFISDGSTRSFNIEYIPADNAEINFYKNSVKIDDPNYDAVSAALALLNFEQNIFNNLTTEVGLLIIDRSEKNSIKEQKLDNLAIQQNLLEQLTADYNQALLDGDMILAMQIEQQVVAQANVVVTANNEVTAATIAFNQADQLVGLKQAELSAQTIVRNSAQAALDALPIITNSNAIMNTQYGDGSSQVFAIPQSVPLSEDDKIVIRESTSDGSFRPDDQTFDVDLNGGDLAYQSARGINPEAINVDGDGFVTTFSSHAPEEVLPGQVVDTVDIQVFNKVNDGSPAILNRFYKVVDPSVLSFDIGQRLGTIDSLFVKINNNIVTVETDYLVDYRAQQIRLTVAPLAGDEISITSLNQNGVGILDLDFFISDGVTTDYVSSARSLGDYTVFVTVDGISESVTTFIADNTFENEGNIVFRFGSAPAQGSVINYTIIDSFVNTISKVQRESFTYDGINNSYTLKFPPLIKEPLENNVIVVTGGRILKSIDNYYFDVIGSSRTYSVSSTDYLFNSIDPTDVAVYVNGVEATRGKDWNWVSANNELKLKRNVANTGDKITLSILKDANYLIEGDTITIYGNYQVGTTFDVTTFSNHDILDIQRYNDQVRFDSALVPGTVDYLKFTQLTSGRIALNKQSLGPQYIWLTVNGELLVPEVDYYLENNLKFIRIIRALSSLDVIEVIVFNSEITRSAFGYRIFKDMTNRVSYKRFDDATSTELAEPLNSFDAKITVVDASLLTTPDAQKNEPGVLVIDKERIEYFKKTGNILSQLRRGTLGTGIKTQHSAGTKVRDQSTINTIPYRDEVQSVDVISDGYSVASAFYDNSPGVTVSSITYDFNNQTAFPLGGQVTTVIGTGFTDTVKVFVGDVNVAENECVTTFVNETTLTFITKPKSVGAYDLTIVNPPRTTPFNIPVTSVVVPQAIKYVQILLPFAPRPNPTSATGWYKESIPEEYWESMDIEVFVGGRRLRKSPVEVFDPSLGQDSPSGNKMLEAEFAVNKNIGAYVRLTEAPPPGVKIIVQKRIGRTWTDGNTTLLDANSDPAKFIRAKGVDLSE
jgi:hypothetical protein